MLPANHHNQVDSPLCRQLGASRTDIAGTANEKNPHASFVAG
jgi:hypothetical protein